jgi:hypothetical protein
MVYVIAANILAFGEEADIKVLNCLIALNLMEAKSFIKALTPTFYKKPDIACAF